MLVQLADLASKLINYFLFVSKLNMDFWNNGGMEPSWCLNLFKHHAIHLEVVGIEYKTNTVYSRTSIIWASLCHFNVKSVQISELVRISELSDKYTI